MDRTEFDPDVYEFYKAALEGPGFDVPFHAEDLPQLREGEIARHIARSIPYEVYQKESILIARDGADPLPARVYVPEGAACKGASVPVLLYFHGGGFIMGGVAGHDHLCGKLADAFRSVVISVEYRLAPEYPFPACIDDAVCAACWAKQNAARYGGDPDHLMAGGDSSGANISAALALLGRDGKAPELSGLILFYGTYGCIPEEESESAKRFGQGDYVLPLRAMETMIGLYVPEGTAPADPRLHPGRAADLSGLPPAIIVSAGLDPLRDDGEEFARRLAAAGNDVLSIRMDGMMHGFILYWQHFRRAEKLIDRIGKIVRDLSV